MNLPEIQIIIKGIKYENTFNDDIKIDRTNLDDELSTQAEKYAYYAFLAEEAENLVSLKKAELDQLYAKIDCEKRSQAISLQAQNKGFKYTETMCENEVITDPRYVQVQSELHKSQLLAGQLKVCATAFSQRREMLVSLGMRNREMTMPTKVLNKKEEQVHAIIAENSSEQQNSRRKPL